MEGKLGTIFVCSVGSSSPNLDTLHGKEWFFDRRDSGRQNLPSFLPVRSAGNNANSRAYFGSVDIRGASGLVRFYSDPSGHKRAVVKKNDARDSVGRAKDHYIDGRS